MMLVVAWMKGSWLAINESKTMDPGFLSLPSILRKDFLTCNICYELYKLPKLLPCLHSYCLECLQLLEENGSLCCPDCRLKVDVSDGVSRLMTNFFINSLLELFQSRLVKDLHCTTCSNEPLSAISHCADCCDLLCPTCSKGHCCSHPTLRHKVVDTNDLPTEQAKEVKCEQAIHCQDHQQEPMSFFCETCSIPICRNCRLLCHFQHQVICKAHAVQKDRCEVKEVIDGLEMTIGNISECNGKVDEKLVMFWQANDHIREIIMRFVDKATSHLQQLKATTLAQLDLIKKQNLEMCQSVKQKLESQRAQTVSAREIFLKVIDHGKDYDKMCMGNIMRNWIKDVHICAPQELELQIPKLVVSFDENNISQIQLFSLVVPNVVPEVASGAQSDKYGVLAEEAFPMEHYSPIASSLTTGEAIPTGVGMANEDALLTGESSLVGDTMNMDHVLPTGATVASEGNMHARGSLPENEVSAGENFPSKDTLVPAGTLPSGRIVSTVGVSSTRSSLVTAYGLSSAGSLPCYEEWSDESDYFDKYRGYGIEDYDGYGFGEDHSLECDSLDYDLSEISSKDEYDWILTREPPTANTKPQFICSFRVNQLPNSGMPKITGVAVLGSGEILMADGNNDDIKVFSADGELCECIILPEMAGQPPPCGITVCGNTLVCSAGCYLLFMTLEGKLLHRVKLRGLQPQYAITAFKSNYVAVNEGTHCSVALYNTSGHCVGRVLPTGYQGGKFLFIAVNSREVFIVSDFFKKKIILFQKSGEIINVIDASTPLLRDPFSVCVDKNDHIFVVDQDTVLEFTPNGIFGRVVLRAEKTVEYPRIIAMDKHRRLIVVQKKDHTNILQL